MATQEKQNSNVQRAIQVQNKRTHTSFSLKRLPSYDSTRPFKYDLNQIPYDYRVEVKNRFKGLDLIECLKNNGQRFVTLYRRW